MDLNSSEYAQAPLKDDGGLADRQYLIEKERRAKALGKDYSPTHYFSDLTEIKLREKANDFDRRALGQVNMSIQNMLHLFHENVRNARKDITPQGYDELMAELDAARSKHLYTLDPVSQAKSDAYKAKMEAPGYWRGQALNLMARLFRFYLKNMPLALILLFFWWYQDHETWRIKNPGSFLLVLLFYPYFIIRKWRRQLREGGREFAMAIELKRRQADIFSLFSEDEMADIKRFAKSNLKIKDYKQYLDNQGLLRQNALTPVVVLAAALIILPASITYGSSLDDFEPLPTCSLSISSASDVLTSVDEDVGPVQHWPVPVAWLNENKLLCYQQRVVKLFVCKGEEEKEGFRFCAEAIPLYS